MAVPTAASAAEIERKFDFGGPTTPVAAGWTKVASGTSYSAALGYGFLSGGTSFRDRGGSGPVMERAFVNGAWEFAVDLPNASYEVTTWSGDLTAGNSTDFSVEGVKYNSKTAIGVYDKHLTTVQVSDGRLNIVGSRDGRINGLIVQSPVAVPAVLTADVDASSTPSVALSWGAVASATSYQVYRSTETTELELVATTTAASFVDSDVEVADGYGYAVRAISGERQSELSATLAVNVVDADVPVPAAPTGLAVSAIAERELTLDWDDSDALRWKVYRTTRADIPFTLIGSTTDSTWTDSTVLTTRPFFYQVVAVNPGGVSAPSESVTTEVTTTLVRKLEYLDRAPVGVVVDGGVYLGWRLLGLDDRQLGFNVYRDGELITPAPLTGATNFVDPEGTIDARYLITAIEGEQEISVTDEFQPRDEQYLDIPIQSPGAGYRAADASVGDLDGDGSYEIVFSWNPADFPDNSIAGFTQSQYLDAYKLDGTRLWRIDLGRNIRAGAHYTQFQVFDYDSDGRAEIAFKTSDGVVDGTGHVLGDPNADHRNSLGRILTGPEWLSIFDGLTGAEIDTVDFIPQRGNVADWGDEYGNRVDRFLGATAYLDGVHPSLIMSRGYYTRTVIGAWDLVDGELVSRWVFDSDVWGEQYEGQGNHNLAPADVDCDGQDEIVFGSMTIDDNGAPLYNSNLHHGDSLHVADHDPSRPGLEIFSAFEEIPKNGGIGSALRDAETGEVIYSTPATEDTGRAAAGDIDPNYPGNETWAIDGDVYNSPTGTMKSATGELVSTSIPPALFTAWWDGDLLREIPDVTEFSSTSQRGIPVVKKWNPETKTTDIILRDDELWSVDGTKAAPMIQADILGDWREELVWPNKDYSAMRLYTTVDVTETRLPTLMHDSQYRTGVAWQNTAYNQPPWPSYFLGADMAEPPLASISYVNAPEQDGTAPVITGLPSGSYADSADLVIDPEVSDAESGIRSKTITLDGEAVAAGSTIDLSGKIGSHTVAVTATNHVGLTTTAQSEFLVLRDDGATKAPGTGTLSNTSGWKNGLHDGNFDVVMNLWYGTPGSVLKIYENGTLISTKALPATGGTSQTSTLSIAGKANGTYVYTGELINLKGSTATSSTTVTVTAANPAKPVLSHNNWDGDGAFTLTANLWWGTNATGYRFELDGQVVGTGALTPATPNAQTATVALTGIAKGTHTARVVFTNAAGETASDPITIPVTK
ncbi:hypothetical protein HQQ81_11880 [Microbacteriaceae bacterium VKM Ac-2854]|nr:hypothetical protein [Microbacteriaceae bacterium VKM Ac-2854]